MLQGYYMERHAREHMNDCMRVAATERQLRASGLVKPGPLGAMISREVARLGGMLVSLGRRLELLDRRQLRPREHPRRAAEGPVLLRHPRQSIQSATQDHANPQVGRGNGVHGYADPLRLFARAMEVRPGC